jgi:hypothetical protein
MPKSRRPAISRSFRSHRHLAIESLEPRSLLAADMVLQWNEIMLEAIRADSTNPPRASRAMAIVHAAIYDSVNAIDRTHEVYAVNVFASPLTSREAAVAAAAHATLTSLIPSQQAAFDAALTAALATIPDGTAENLGVALGQQVAAQMLALRANDGSTAVVSYTPGSDPGDWQPTPPGFASALFPQWPGVTPFAMTSGNQFSPDNIPALTSAAYAAAFNEVKDLGAVNSATRTQDQTDIALFWANGGGTATPPGHLNMLAQIVAEAQGNTLSENARLFAMLNVAMADAAIMAWDCKYVTDFWRPVTGIRAADTDGNPDTVQDPAWSPLIATPPFPSYVSGHSSFSGAAAAVLADFFGTDNIAFTLPSENQAVGARQFDSFSEAAQESADSRLYGGIHWRFDNEDGLTAGTALGQFVADNFFEPVPATAQASLVGTTLVVTGTEGRDSLAIVRVRNQLVVFLGSRKLGTFAISQVTSIAVDARGGNDVVRIGADIGIAATIMGGAGDDILIGGRGNDQIFGGEGHDYLFGMLGNDQLDGGNGNDWLFGGPGFDTFIGGTGKNRLFQ